MYTTWSIFWRDWFVLIIIQASQVSDNLHRKSTWHATSYRNLSLLDVHAWMKKWKSGSFSFDRGKSNICSNFWSNLILIKVISMINQCRKIHFLFEGSKEQRPFVNLTIKIEPSIFEIVHNSRIYCETLWFFVDLIILLSFWNRMDLFLLNKTWHFINDKLLLFPIFECILLCLYS